jgi:hypothetical protein
MAAPLDVLVEQLRERAAPDAYAWLEGELGTARLAGAFAAAARRVGRAPLGDGVMQGADDPVPLGPFTLDIAARAALLLASTDPPLQALYDTADTREKIAIVRTLPLLPDGTRFVAISLDAGRTNDTELFRAVACDTPFPARHYPELEFNKLVMKSAFVGAPVDRILGLERRANAELTRMVMEYIDEQESARRRFPPEAWLAVARHPLPGCAGRMLGYLGHSSAQQRLGAARALAILKQPRTRSFLDERLEVERDEAVRAALREALEEMPE